MKVVTKITWDYIILTPSIDYLSIESDKNNLLLRTKYNGEEFKIEKNVFDYDVEKYANYDSSKISNEDIIAEYLENGFIDMESKL